jgi:alcohol dehydrogenase, propanol-preferring
MHGADFLIHYREVRMATMMAYRLTEWGREPELATVPVPRPGPRDVLLRVGGAGACQSDLHLMDRRDA